MPDLRTCMRQPSAAEAACAISVGSRFATLQRLLGLSDDNQSEGKIAEALFHAVKLSIAPKPDNKGSKSEAPDQKADISPESMTVAFWRCLHAGDESAARFCFDFVRCCGGADSGEETGNMGQQVCPTYIPHRVFLGRFVNRGYFEPLIKKVLLAD